MMKKIFLVTVCCTILLAISPVAYSLDEQYISGSIGYAKITNMNLTNRELFAVQHKDVEPDGGVALALAMGCRFFDMLRAEGELSYQQNDISQGGPFTVNGDISYFALMLNGYFEPGGIEETGKYKPYFTFGLGWATVDNDFSLRTEERYFADGYAAKVVYNGAQGSFAYQIGAGVGYALNEKITIDCRYRYQWLADLTYTTTQIEYNSHNFFVGIRYTF